MVQQHFSLIPSLTVLDMIGLIHPESRRVLYKTGKVRSDIEQLSKRYGLEVNPDAYIWKLSAGEQQRVEILKALTAGAKILLLDEPSAVLTPVEVRRLFGVLRSMAESLTVLVSTHKMDEVLDLCDTVTVMRGGEVVFSDKVTELDLNRISRLIVGEDLALARPLTEKKDFGESVLEVKNLKVRGDLGHVAVQEVSFEVRKGEILGIAGEAGNGQKELVETVFGLRDMISGRVFLKGEDATGLDPKAMFELGVRYIPEEGYRRGGCSEMSVADNTVLNRYRYEPFSRHFLLHQDERDNFASQIVERFHVQTDTHRKPLRYLSGGNAARVIVGRELTGDFDLLIAVHPTIGQDLRATAMIFETFRSLREQGKTILLVSESLSEICELSDRVLVMSRGQMKAELTGPDINRNNIGAIIAGAA
jgi:simple sugar transport system ATP-binding protein